MPGTKYFTAKEFSNEIFDDLCEALTLDDDAARPIEYADIARLAIGVSLASGEFESLGKKQWDRDGKEFNDYSLDPDNVLKNCCAIRHAIDWEDYARIRELMEFHMNSGLEYLRKLWDEAGKDKLHFIELILALVPEPAGVAPSVSSPQELKVYVGETCEIKPERVYLSVNQEGGQRANPHIAIAGSSGVGKTQLLLAILTQVLSIDDHCGCLLFDYKGDISRQENWQELEALGFQKFILGDQPFPINPLRIPHGTKPEAAAQEFAETCGIHSRKLGHVQKGDIRRGLTQLYKLASAAKKPMSSNGELWPTLGELRRTINEMYEKEDKKRDLLTELFDQLAEFQLFEENEGLSLPEFLARRIVLDMSQQGAFRELSAFFTLHFLLQGMRNLGETPVTEGEVRFRKLRSIVVLDEADRYLRTRPGPIYDILRLGRSFGICLWLSSQSIADYEAEKDEFANNVDTWFLFKQGKLPSEKDLAGLLKISLSKAKALAEQLPSLDQGHCFCRVDGDPREIVAAQLYQKQSWMR